MSAGQWGRTKQRKDEVKMKRIFACLTVVLAAVVFGAPHFGAAQSAPPWLTFHGNTSRNGSTSAPGPTTSTAANEWSFPGPVESSVAVGPDGVGYVGDDDHNVYALDPSNPTAPAWFFKTGGLVTSSPTLSPDGKTLYVGSQDGNVYALSTQNPTCTTNGPIKTCTANKIWSTNLGGPVNGSPLLSADGSTLFVANANGDLRALHASDGSTAWGPFYFTAIPGSLALSPDGSTLYIATYSGYLYATPAVGTNAGKTYTAFYLDYPATGTPAVDSNGNIYVATTEGSLISFSPGNTTPRWTFTIPNHTPAGTTPAVANGMVYFGDGDQNFYALNASNGQQVWFHHTGGPIGSSAAISGNNLIYVGSDDGNIYAFGTSGQVAWIKPTGVPIHASPAIGPDGSMWVGGQNYIVYRIKDLSGPPGPGTAPATNTPTAGPTATGVPTATPTSTGPTIAVSLKAKVKPGQRQTITVKTTAKTIVRFRVVYPNGQHQSHHVTSNASGVGKYSYLQPASRIMHNRFVATVIVKVGNPPNQKQTSKTYRISFGNMDASVEPRTQSAGKVVNIYVHTRVGLHVVIYLLFPSGRFTTLTGKAGPHGFAHKRLKIPRGQTRGRNHTVKVVAKIRSGRPNWSASTTFTIK
jgi:outer membrane protein assembly factor BamB